MATRPSEQAILMRRRGKSLVPTDAMGEEAIEKIKADDEVMVWIKRPRNPRHHRKFMAMVNLIFRHQSKYETMKQLLTAIKLRTGHYESYIVDSKPVVVAESISYEAMGQSEFETFYDRVLDIVVSKIIPGLRRSDLKQELEGFARQMPPDRDADEARTR